MDVRITKINETLTFPAFADLPVTSQNYLYGYALKQRLNDVHASVFAKDFATEHEWHVAVREKVAGAADQILTGNVPGTKAPADSTTARRGKAMVKALAIEAVSDEEFAKILAEIAEFRAARAQAA